jgi:MFS family permease
VPARPDKPETSPRPGQAEPSPREEKTARRNELIVRKHLVRNYIAHCIEGGLFMGGMQFLSAQSVLPVVFDRLDAPAWLTAMAPILMVFGIAVTPLLIAHRVERMERHKVFVATVGVFQRLPYLLAGLALIWLADRMPWVTLAAVALSPLLCGMFGGVGMVAWKELVAKTIPARRRSGVWAVRYIIASVIGLFAGEAVRGVLRDYPGPEGYGVLHLYTFVFLTGSYLIFLTVHETPYVRPPKREERSAKDIVTQPATLLRRDPALLPYLLTIGLAYGMLVIMPFLSIHALEVLDRSEDFAGVLLVAQMAGAIIGNMVAGYLGDRFGGRVPMAVGIVAFVGLSIWALLATSEWAFLAVFFLMGWSWYSLRVGRMTLDLEMAPEQGRPTYQAIMGVFSALSMLLASQVGALSWDWSGKDFAWPVGIGASMLALGLVLLTRLPPPREAR